MQLLGSGDNVVKEYSSTELQTMKVNDDTSGIKITDAKSAQSIVTLSGDVLMVNVDGILRIVDAQGRLCAEIPGVKAGNTVNLNALPKGFYIVEIGSETAKIILK
ncbi:MAG: T9SS type A sorting domain-containing protein [Muribaculaceae bacterium]